MMFGLRCFAMNNIEKGGRNGDFGNSVRAKLQITKYKIDLDQQRIVI